MARLMNLIVIIGIILSSFPPHGHSRPGRKYSEHYWISNEEYFKGFFAEKILPTCAASEDRKRVGREPIDVRVERIDVCCDGPPGFEKTSCQAYSCLETPRRHGDVQGNFTTYNTTDQTSEATPWAKAKQFITLGFLGVLMLNWVAVMITNLRLPYSRKFPELGESREILEEPNLPAPVSTDPPTAG